MLIMTPVALARTVEDFLAGARDAIVLDDGAAVFDLAQAKYSISGEHFCRLVYSVGEVRHAEGPRDDALWRLHPERWLESLVVQDVTEVDERLDPSCRYSQVPAFSASDRAMIDVLTAVCEGRLAVVELKADCPLQGLDYWSRVAWHHSRGEFQRFGYFPGRELSPERPLLFLVAPALHVHLRQTLCCTTSRRKSSG